MGSRLLLKRQERKGVDRKETAVRAPRPDVLRSAEILHSVGFSSHLRMVIGGLWSWRGSQTVLEPEHNNSIIMFYRASKDPIRINKVQLKVLAGFFVFFFTNFDFHGFLQM